MEPSQHTNGPWEILMNPKEDYLLIENVDRCDFHPVCAIYGEGKKQEANAHLIAAAPELLDALKYAQSIISSMDYGTVKHIEDNLLDEAIDENRILEAISRATL